MKWERLAGILAAVVVVMVSACSLLGWDRGGTDPVPVQPARLSCVDLQNGMVLAPCRHGNTAAGWLRVISSAQAAETVVDRGQVSRSYVITALGTIENLTVGPFEGYVEAVFDAGCNGAGAWEIMPKQAVTVAEGDSLTISAGGQCGDMPLGARTLTATAYGADGTTVVDRVIVQFELIE